MKIAIAALLVGSAAAFAPIAQPAVRLNALNAVVTGAKGKPAKTKEEDMELTREIILSYISVGGDDDSKAEEEAPAEKSEE